MHPADHKHGQRLPSTPVQTTCKWEIYDMQTGPINNKSIFLTVEIISIILSYSLNVLLIYNRNQTKGKALKNTPKSREKINQHSSIIRSDLKHRNQIYRCI